MNWQDHINSDNSILHGQACFTGTRIPVTVVLDNLAAGKTYDYIHEQYPSITQDHIAAAISYAADLARERIIKLSA